MTGRYVEAIEKSEGARLEYASAIKTLSELGFGSYEKAHETSPLAKALGFPFSLSLPPVPSLSKEYVGKDDLCEIFRIRISSLPSLPFFGLMFVPHGIKPPYPLCIAAHGNLGTPELMYGMHGKNGYSDLIARLMARGFCVFAPQLLLWNKGQSPAKPQYKTGYDRLSLDTALKAKGSGINAVEIFSISRALDALLNLHIFNEENISVCGMSYGALLTLRTMALDARIKRGYFMCCFNGGIDPRFPEWDTLPGATVLRDSDIAGLCAPRPVFVEVAAHDEFFPLDGALREAELAREKYASGGVRENFNFSVYDGFHIVPPQSRGVEFITELSSL